MKRQVGYLELVIFNLIHQEEERCLVCDKLSAAVMEQIRQDPARMLCAVNTKNVN